MSNHFVFVKHLGLVTQYSPANFDPRSKFLNEEALRGVLASFLINLCLFLPLVELALLEELVILEV